MCIFYVFFFNDTATTEIYTLSLHDALPISGILTSVPVLANQVLFNSIDANNDGLELHDDGNGILSGDGAGTINYVTGAYILNFANAPADNAVINSQTRPYVASRPDAILRSEEHTSELQSHSFISYAVFCLKKKTKKSTAHHSAIP